MRAIDIAIFMIIFQVVANLIAVSYAPLMGFGNQPLMQTHVGSTPQQLRQSLWSQLTNIATNPINIGVLAGTALASMLGQYYLATILISALLVMNIIPQFQVFTNALPMLLISLGVPDAIAKTVLAIYNIILIFSLIIWVYGRSLKEYD